MAEYIKREDAIHDIRYDCFGLENYTRRDAIDCINALPAADVTEVRHGRWLADEKHNYAPYCSICGYEPIVAEKTIFCPNCGALMREIGNGEK